MFSDDALDGSVSPGCAPFASEGLCIEGVQFALTMGSHGVDSPVDWPIAYVGKPRGWGTDLIQSYTYECENRDSIRLRVKNLPKNWFTEKQFFGYQFWLRWKNGFGRLEKIRYEK
jgi:hypothetical protein